MEASVQFTLLFEGETSDAHMIDLYDVSQALIGFQRSLALTTHLAINQKIITQAPSLKGARVLAFPPKEGSWGIVGLVIAGATVAYKLGTAPKNTPLGHVVFSIYDYIVKESLGVHVDYDKTLGQLYEENKPQETGLPKIEQHHVDALIEKCSTAITEIHRPIYKTYTATKATIVGDYGQGLKIIGSEMTQLTYEYIHEEFVNEMPEVLSGKVSSYNSNTFKGRIYVAQEGRPVSFELTEHCRSNDCVQLIVRSLSANAIKEYDNEWSEIYCRVFKVKSCSGHLKRYKILEISHVQIDDD